MVKRMVFEYQIIQFAKRHDVDRLMQTATNHRNDENHVATVRHRIPAIQNASVPVHRCHCIKQSMTIAQVQPIRVR